MQIQINHTTEYAYDEPVSYALQKVRLRPIGSTLQEVTDWELHVEGGTVETSYTDHYGNLVDLISTDVGAEKLQIIARGTVATNDLAGVLGKTYGRAPLWHFKQVTPLTCPDDGIKVLSETIAQSATPLDGLHALSMAVLAAVPYQIGVTGADTTAQEALEIGQGVCQDHAHIFIAAARVAGFPARYVSGYLMINGQIDQDASHAWAEVHLDTLGWVGFDVSNGVAPDEKYVRIAIGRDAKDAAPISGMRLGTGQESLIVTLQVQQ